MNKSIKLPTLILVLFLSSNTQAQFTIFSHGIADTYRQIFKYKDLIQGQWVSFNYPDATLGRLRVNYHHTSFGQENEIVKLAGAHNVTLEQEKDADIVLWGVSRGGANVCIFGGTYDMRNIKAIVVESPYDSMSTVIKHAMKKCRLDWLPLSYGERLAEFLFKKYTRHGIRPIDVLENIPSDMPILIICSKEDSLVPYYSSIAVYKKLRDTNHNHVYILCLDHGKHAKFLLGSDAEKYRSVVHAFYKKYSLQHNPLYASNGDNLLSECQPIFE